MVTFNSIYYSFPTCEEILSYYYYISGDLAHIGNPTETNSALTGVDSNTMLSVQGSGVGNSNTPTGLSGTGPTPNTSTGYTGTAPTPDTAAVSWSQLAASPHKEVFNGWMRDAYEVNIDQEKFEKTLFDRMNPQQAHYHKTFLGDVIGQLSRVENIRLTDNAKGRALVTLEVADYRARYIQRELSNHLTPNEANQLNLMREALQNTISAIKS